MKQLSSGRKYSTAQLQGNVRTRFRRVSHAFWTRPSSSEKGAWHSRTSCCSFIARFCACMDASHVRPRRILHAFQTRSDVTLELSCTVIEMRTVDNYPLASHDSDSNWCTESSDSEFGIEPFSTSKTNFYVGMINLHN